MTSFFSVCSQCHQLIPPASTKPGVMMLNENTRNMYPSTSAAKDTTAPPNPAPRTPPSSQPTSEENHPPLPADPTCPVTRRSSRQTKPRAPLEEVSSSSEAEEDSAQPETAGKEDVHSIRAISTAMEKAGLVVLSPSWLKNHESPLLLACWASKCLKGINVQNGIAHTTRREEGGHGLRVSKEVVIELEKWIGLEAHLFLSSETAFHEAPGPQVTTKPVPILKVEPGLRCTSDNCSYRCLKPGAMATHWSEEHKGKRVKKKSKKVKVQTFEKYFAVSPSLLGSPANSCYELYLTQLVPDLEKDCHEVVPYLASEREVPPLLKVMQWHEHLSPHLLDETEASDEPSSKDSQKLSLFSLAQMPSPSSSTL